MADTEDPKTNVVPATSKPLAVDAVKPNLEAPVAPAPLAKPAEPAAKTAPEAKPVAPKVEAPVKSSGIKPVAAEPVKAKPVGKTLPVEASAVKVEPVKPKAVVPKAVPATTSAKIKPAKVASAKIQPAKVAPVKVVPVTPVTKVAKDVKEVAVAAPVPKVATNKAAPKTATKPASQPAAGKPVFAGLFSNFMLEETTMDMSANFTGFQDAITEAQAKAKAAFEKSTSVLGEVSEFAKGNVEAAVESGKIYAEGVQALGSEFVTESRAAFEKMSGDVKELAAAKSPTDFFKLQSDLVRKNFDTAVAYGSKNSEAMLKLMSDTFAPISGRVSLAVEKARSASSL